MIAEAFNSLLRDSHVTRQGGVNKVNIKNFQFSLKRFSGSTNRRYALAKRNFQFSLKRFLPSAAFAYTYFAMFLSILS